MSKEVKDTSKTKAEGKSGGNTGLVIGVLVVALLGAGAYFASTKMGTESAAVSGEMNEIAPASDGQAAEAGAASDASTEDAQTASSDGEAQPQSSAMPEIRDGNPVVAKVGGEDIMRADVLNYIVGMPEQMRQLPIQTLFPLATQQVVSNRLLEQKAEAADLENDEQVQENLSQAKEQIIRNVYLDREINERITEERLREAYDGIVEQMGEVQETRARHILVETQEEASALITQLNDGADFAELATQNSTGPTASNGGDLGYFAQAEMVPEFANAAFGLEVGAVSQEPVQTQFGWHVIKVEDRRQREVPAFEAVRPQLEAQLRQQIMNELVQSWQEEANVEVFDINGDPLDVQ